MFDLTTKLGIRAEKRLKDEYLIWLTTISESGAPEPNPVWFYWDGKALIMYSQPSSYKVGNIARNPNVSLNFQADNEGGDIIVLTGTATLDRKPARHDPAYIEKYRDLIPKIGLTPETLATTYSVQITITPRKLRGF